MDILDVIKNEHREVGALIDKIEPSEPDSDELRTICRQITDALTMHAQNEEKLFYPVLRDRAEEDDQIVDVFEGYTEHDVIKHLIALANSGRKPDEKFKAELQVLGENVKHHVKEEESTIFGIAKDVLDDDEREQLGVKWEKAKQRMTSSSQSKTARGRKKAPARKAAARKTTARKKSPARKRR